MRIINFTGSKIRILSRFMIIPGIFILSLTACDNGPRVIDITEKKDNKKENKEEALQSMNREIVRIEEQFIENYIDRHDLDVEKLKSGIRYDIYKENPSGRKVEHGDQVRIQYSIELLTGDKVEKTDSSKSKRFIVAKTDQIQGLHWSVMQMQENEKGIFIIPSKLAHGITGKEGKIPHSAALVYDIELTNVNKKPSNEK